MAKGVAFTTGNINHFLLSGSSNPLMSHLFVILFSLTHLFTSLLLESNRNLVIGSPNSCNKNFVTFNIACCYRHLLGFIQSVLQSLFIPLAECAEFTVLHLFLFHFTNPRCVLHCLSHPAPQRQNAVSAF